jgi:astacin
MACIITDGRFWPDGKIPYEIKAVDFPSGSSARAKVLAAIKVWNEQTLLRLIPHLTELNFVEFVKAEKECQSEIGMRGGAQRIGCALGSHNFSKWSVVHEIGHAFGLFHEQTRLDRDKWVTVHWDNIIPSKEDNFKVLTKTRRDICAYDYDSIMHYGEADFAVDESKPTLTPSVKGAVIGQRDHLSWRDKKAVEFVHGRFSVRMELENRDMPYELRVSAVKPHGGSVREWIVCQPPEITVQGGAGTL